MPHQLKVPPTQTPAHAPQQQFLVATRLLWGRTYRVAATNCGIGVRPWVIKSERFFLIHDRPPLPRSSSSPWFDILFCLTLLECHTAGQQFGARFSLSLCLLVFIPLWLIILLLIIMPHIIILLIILRGGVVGPAHEVAGPEPCDVGHLLGNVWHKIHQCHG